MGRSPRRAARSVCLVAAGVCLLLAFTTASAPAQEAEEDTAPRPEVFRGAASSQAASVLVDREALLPVADLFRFIALDGSSTYESSTRQARASLLFPGNGLILGPNLLCGTFGSQLPAELKPVLDACLQYRYPLTVFADEFAPDGTSSGSLTIGAPTDPVSARVVRAEAHAAEDAATTDAALQDLSVLGLPALGPVLPLIPGLEMDTSLLRIDSATSRTDQRIEQGSLVIDSTATLSGIRLIGGLVRIGSLRSESHVTDDAKGGRTAEASLEVSGVTVAGIPAQITEDGLVLGNPTGGLGPLVQQLQAQLNDLLRSLGLRVALLSSEETTDGEDGAVASAGGLLIELATPVDGLPTIPGPLGDIDPNGIYVVALQLGSTAARGAAYAVDPDAPPVEDPGVSEGGFDTGGGFDSGGDFVLPDLVAAPPAAPASEPTAAAPDQELVRSVVDLFGDRLGLVYLALMFATLGLCVVPGFAVPARLPGPRS